MQLPPFVEQNKTLVIGGIAGLIAMLIAGYFVYSFMQSNNAPVTVDASVAKAFLPANLKKFDDTTKKDKLDLKNTAFKESEFVKRAKDYSTTVPTSTVRGRDNPFLPYDFTGSSR